MSGRLDTEQQLASAQLQLQRIAQQIQGAGRDRDPVLAEMVAALSISIEELSVTFEELYARQEELLTTRQTLEWTRYRFQSLFEAAPDACVVTDEQGIICMANVAAEVLLNMRRDRLVGKPLSLFMAAADHGCLYTQSERLARLTAPMPNSEPLLLLQNREVALHPRQQGELPASLSLSATYDIVQDTWALNWVFRDLRERKRLEAARQAAETAMRASEEQRRLALELTGTGWWDWDMMTGELTWSEHLYQLLGYAPGEVRPTVQHWRDRIHPDDLAHTDAALRRDLERHTTGQVEYRVVHPDGRIRWLLVRGQGIYDASGQPVRMVGTAMDISDRKEAELRVRQSEARLRLITNSLPACISYTDRDQRYRFVNQTYETWFGHPQEALLGCTVESVIGPDAYRRVQAYIERVFAGETVTYEACMPYPEDTPRHVSAILVPDSDDQGQVQGYYALVTDISDRKRAEQQIRQQAALIDIAADAIFVRDLAGQIRFWSQGAERLYGWRAETAVGQKAEDLFAREAPQGCRLALQTALQTGYWHGELVHTTQSGRQIRVTSRWTLMRDDAGDPESLLVVNTDITEQKQLEAQYYQAQRLESLGRLSSGIAHDLNNVLTPILTIAQLLQLTQPDLDTSTQERLKLLEDSAKRGANMVQQMLTFVRGSKGDRERVELAPLLQEVVSIAQQSLPKTIEIRADFPSDEATASLGMVEADPTQLVQVFINLCINARDAMPDGGTLTLTAENVWVDEATAQLHLDAQVGHYVVVTVADTGTGIMPEVRDRIFDPFFTTKESGYGTGLGLATVLGIVKNYGGFLQVLTEVGQGTAMGVYLPALEGNGAAVNLPEVAIDGNGELILVVDDDVAVQQSNCALLESHRYRTLAASDGIEAIAQYVQHQAAISLVVMDVMMPNLGGVPLIGRLKSMNPAVKILAISGLATNQDAVLSAGADAFLAKPYSLEALLCHIWDLANG